MTKASGAWRLFVIAMVAFSVSFSLVPYALADGTGVDPIVSLTAPTMPVCPSPNGNGGDWCQSSGVPFDLSSFTTQNLTTTGSSAFFAIDNDTGSEVTSLSIFFDGTAADNQVFTCGGGGSGIQGSGPGNSSTTTCTVNGYPGSTGYPLGGSGSTQVPVSVDYDWNNLTWGSGQTFDLQIASFANGDTGTFGTAMPESSSTLTLLAADLSPLVLFGLVGFLRKWRLSEKEAY
jgi:hypothetical protein